MNARKQTQWMEISLKHCWYANEGISLKYLNHFSQTWRNSGSIPNSEFRPPSGAAACDSVRFMPPGSGWLVNNPQRKESVNSALPVAPQSTCAPFPAFNKKIIWRFVWKFMQMNNIWTEKLKSLWRNWWLVERTGWTIRGRFTKNRRWFSWIFLLKTYSDRFWLKRLWIELLTGYRTISNRINFIWCEASKKIVKDWHEIRLKLDVSRCSFYSNFNLISVLIDLDSKDFR